jgi:soluble lytic murein transglycosylase
MTKHAIMFLVMILTSSLVIQTASLANNPAQAPILTIDEAMAPARLQQAKEIFGRRSSRTTLVGTTVTRENLTEYIVANLERELPEAYRDHAEDITATILSSSALHSLDPLLVLAVMRQESHYRPDAMGRHGEIGLMQIKPETARWIASRVGISWSDDATLFDPQFNIRIGAAYISFLRERFENHGKHYIAAYNLGPAALRNKLRNNELPTEYSSSLIQHYTSLYQNWLKFDAHLVADLD